LTMNEAWLLERYQATELAARHWHVQCMNLQEQRNAAQLAAQHWHATAQHNFSAAKQWQATATEAAEAAHHQYRPIVPTPTQHSTLGATHPPFKLRPEAVAIEPPSMAVDEQSGTGMSRDRGNAAADAAAAALVAAAAATTVAAAARNMKQFLAATQAATATAAALAAYQATIGQPTAERTTTLRGGRNRPPRGPGARKRRGSPASVARSAEAARTQTARGGRPPRTSTKKRRGNGTMPGPTDSDRPGATQRPIQAGAHSTNSLEADLALVGSNHAPPHTDARVQVKAE
jgi:hypothetical protein